jgi:RNA polymerase sigma-70 factor (ECF subfamily)
MADFVLAQSEQRFRRAIAPESATTFRRSELERLLAENASLAYRVALSVVRNHPEAQDVAQESLLMAYRKFHHLRDAQRFRSWLVRMTFRLALDRKRSARRREARETSWAEPDFRPPPQSAEELAASREFQERLDRALEELPRRLRLVVILNAIEGHTVGEVAELLAISPGTVKSRLFRARKFLAEKLL